MIHHTNTIQTDDIHRVNCISEIDTNGLKFSDWMHVDKHGGKTDWIDKLGGKTMKPAFSPIPSIVFKSRLHYGY